MTQIGHLRHRVVLQERASLPDGAGGFTGGWKNLETEPEIFAVVTALAGRRRFVSSEATHKFLVRYRADITGDMRLVKNGQAYDILSATDREGRGVMLEILARETA